MIADAKNGFIKDVPGETCIKESFGESRSVFNMIDKVVSHRVFCFSVFSNNYGWK